MTAIFSVERFLMSSNFIVNEHCLSAIFITLLAKMKLVDVVSTHLLYYSKFSWYQHCTTVRL